MNTKIPNPHRGSNVEDFFSDVGDDVPPPPDNFDIFNSFPEHFRDRIANQFTRGIEAEYCGIRARVQNEYAVKRARQKEDAERRNQRRPYDPSRSRFADRSRGAR